jgi:pimeloyl-ACP methyl ester carboxylesterase
MSAAPVGLLHAGFSACDAFDVLTRLGEIRAPTLVACGEDDQVTPPKYSTRLRDDIAQAQLVLLPGAGHMVMIEEPAVVAGVIVELFGRVAATPRS